MIVHLRTLAACALLSFYILPKTIFADASPFSWVVLVRTGSANKELLAAISGLCALVALVLFARKLAKGVHYLQITLVAYMVALVASSLLPGASLAAVNDCFAIVLALATGSIAATFVATPRDRIWCIVLLATAQAVCALALRFQGLGVTVTEQAIHAGGTFGNPVLLATAMTVGLPLAFVLGSSSKNTTEAGVLSICAAVMLGALMLTWSLVGFVATGIAALYGAGRILKNPRAVIGLGAALVVAGGFYLAGSAGGGRRLDAHLEALQHRAELATQALSQFPVTGAGVGNVAQMTADPAGAALIAQPVVWISELGVAGIVLYLLFASGVARTALAAKEPEEVAVAAALIGLGIVSLLNTAFASPANICGTVLVAFLAVAVVPHPAKEPEKPFALEPLGQES